MKILLSIGILVFLLIALVLLTSTVIKIYTKKEFTSRTVECNIPGFGKRVFKQVKELDANITNYGIKISFLNKSKPVWLYGKNIVCIIIPDTNKK